MPYILSPIIKLSSVGMWNEGPPYSKRNIYKIENNTIPPVHYDEHILKPHSLTHLETGAHTIENGACIHDIYNSKLNVFFGKTLLIKLNGNNYQPVGNGIYHWEIIKEEIETRLAALGIKKFPQKILITTMNYPENDDGYHDPNYVLTLSQEAANFLVNSCELELYGTSWKSSDFNPGKRERPIHNTLFKKAVILENLSLNHVPEGEYFMNAFPIPLENASESPVVPVLFTKDELYKVFE